MSIEIIHVRGVPVAMADGRPLARRSNIWAARIGFLLGRGNAPKKVAELLGENTTEGTVKGIARRIQERPTRPRVACISFELPSWQRDQLNRHAEHHSIPLDELVRRALESALILDDLYGAITDGRYDE